MEWGVEVSFGFCLTVLATRGVCSKAELSGHVMFESNDLLNDQSPFKVSFSSINENSNLALLVGNVKSSVLECKTLLDSLGDE